MSENSGNNVKTIDEVLHDYKEEYKREVVRSNRVLSKKKSMLMKIILSLTADQKYDLFKTSQDLHYDRILQRPTLRKGSWEDVLFRGSIMKAKKLSKDNKPRNMNI
ncbi:hypothetical protein HELRODRAFT_173795 [Helobdella robusta]|uniref:Uncharacterized protein n=1 Tax=Helobdella robusta TaxID=6412 RepID=T1F785_HELRO|nr:hypothetical protein HELRODRAFT_173795 [Helobdella robusta]ESO03491.1 hypothetical protein HELRODRAFT_173795 [Helobdella robusta]